MIEPNESQVAILFDLTLCMAVFAMSRSCSEIEAEEFFKLMKMRLKEQKFKPEDIDPMIGTYHYHRSE